MENILLRLLNVALLSSAVILAVMIIKAVYKNNIGAKAMSALWALVLIRLLLPVSLDSPLHIADLFTNQNETQIETMTAKNAADYPTDYIQSDFEAPVLPMEGQEIPAQNVEAEQNLASSQAEIVEAKITLFQRIKSRMTKENIISLAMVLWLSVGALIILVPAFSMAAFHAKASKSVVVSKGLLAAAQKARQLAEYKKEVKILESEDVDMPVTYGLFAPKIVIPKNMAETMEEKKLTLIVMHELMHIKKGDILANYLWLAAKAIHWFNPLVWIAYKLYITDMEVMCDYHTVKKLSGTDKANYTQGLLEAAKLIKADGKKPSPVMLHFCGKNTKLRRRIMNILHPINQSRKQILIVGILIVILALGCFTTACTKHAADTSDGTINTEESIAADDYSAEQEQIGRLTAKNEKIPSSLFVNYVYSTEVDNTTIRVALEKASIVRTYLPQNEYFPLVETEKFNINDTEFIEQTLTQFLGDVYYEEEDCKSDVEAKIAAFQNEVEKLGDVEYTQDKLDEILDELETEKKYAPDENTVASPEFSRNLDELRYLEYKSYEEDGLPQYMRIMEYVNHGTWIYYQRGDYALDYVTLGMHELTQSSAEADTSLSEALRQANALVEGLSGDMELCNIFVGKKVFFPLTDVYSEYDLYASSDDVCYSFIYTPVVDGISSAACEIIKDSYETNGLFGFYSTFDEDITEYIQVVADKDGIGTFVWKNRSTVTNYQQDAYKVIPLYEAVHSFEEYAVDEEAILKEFDGTKVIIDINYIYLAMLPVETGEGTYSIIPAYVFSGTQGDGAEEKDYFLTISAIDGSLIQ